MRKKLYQKKTSRFGTTNEMHIREKAIRESFQKASATHLANYIGVGRSNKNK